jgi:hypothetical protein
MSSKFSYITYPFFGTYSVPNITINFNEIKAQLGRQIEKVIKLENSLNYLNELLTLEQLEVNRLKFQITAKSTQELIMSDKRCVWGIDSIGVLHNLKRYEEFRSKCLKPSKITKSKYIWFRGISKPFEVPFSIKNIEEDIMYYWFKLLYIDNVWEIYKINTEYDGNTVESI